MKEFQGGIEAHNDDVDLAVIETFGTIWTNEKHESYLASIEASFVEKLHNSRCNSKKKFNSFLTTPLHSTSTLSAPKMQFIDNVTEVSDQNFVDTEEEPGERLGKKRARSINLSVTDQVVPFTRSEKEEKEEECSKRKIFETRFGTEMKTLINERNCN